MFLPSLAVADVQQIPIPRNKFLPTTDWLSAGTLGTGVSTSAGTTVAVTTTQTLEVNKVAVCVVSSDEAGTGTTDGTGNAQFTSMADSGGSNTWTEAYEWCNMQTSTVANGQCVAVYTSDITSELASGGTITATIASVTAKAITCWEFSMPGTTLTETAGENGLANDGADPGSMTIATGVAQEHLFIRATGCETDTTTYTADTDYLAFDNATADAGVPAAGSAARGEYRIVNESTSAASDPGLAAADCASAMVAFDES